MSYDLGEYVPVKNSRKSQIQIKPEKAVKNIESKLDFVMITERFDESLILLRHYFLPYLDLEDLVYMSQNQAAKAVNKMEESVVNPNPADPNPAEKSQCDRIEEINQIDTAVYKHFFQKFDEMVENFGAEKMKKEVDQLKNLNKQVSEKCFDKPVVNKELANMFGFWWPRNSTHGIKVPMVRKSMLSNKLCRSLARSEKRFYMYLWEKFKSENKN